MATLEQPITRSELREELRHYASKADLAQMETRLTRWMVGMMPRRHCRGVLRILGYPEDTRLI